MTTVCVERDAQGVRGLSVSGHAGYAAKGHDIVCAAASVLITTCVNALESVAGIRPLVEQSADTARIRVSLPQSLALDREHDARIVLRTVLRGYEDIAAAYPDHLRIL